jgi:hypothetical protein
VSRSNDHGCVPNCGLCHPTKRYKHQLSRKAKMKISDQRRAGYERVR